MPAIAQAAKELVEMRERWLNAEGLSEAERKKRTLTNLYNARPTWLDLAHKKLDAAVFAAYGWPSELGDEEILERLLGLISNDHLRIIRLLIDKDGLRMDITQIIALITSITTLVSAIAAILAWIAKIRWSKEHTKAMNETIRANSATIEIKDNQLQNLIINKDAIIKAKDERINGLER